MVVGINVFFDLLYCVLYQVSLISIDSNAPKEHLKPNLLFFLKLR